MDPGGSSAGGLVELSTMSKRLAYLAFAFTLLPAPARAEFQVNTYTTGFQGYPAIATDAAGNFVVVWEDRPRDGSYTGIFGQRFTSSGALSDGDFQINVYTPDFQFIPKVGADLAGNFV